jgi:O-antigen/teichoic acid export membrane protein
MAENISIKRNVAANYASNLYAVLVSVLMAPVYLSYMGTEAYGLIGFFTMLTALFQLLDMGLTPTIVRETALFRGGQITVGRLKVFIRGLEIIFGIVSVATALVVLLLTHQIAAHWLKVGSLPITDVEVAVGIMGAILPLRWVAGLYRGLVVGFERMTWLSAYNIAIATLRFVGVLAVFHLVGTNVKFFFAYQFLVSVIDLSGIAVISHRLVGAGKGAREPFSWAPLKANATFSLVIAFVSTSWVVLTQSDKLVLSKVIPLAAFGVFSLAVAAANVISIVGGPISQALLPRLTKLFAEGREDALYRLYANATQTVGIFVFPAVSALVFLGGPVFRAWTGHADIARQAAPIVALYAVGNGAVALGSFAYYVQYAKGNLRLHFIGNAVMLVVLIPAFIWGAIHYGPLGTGAAWAAANSLFVLFWVPVIHARFLPGRHWDWVWRNILPIGVPTLLVCWLLSLVVTWPSGRLAQIATLAGIGALLLMVSVAGSSFARETLMDFFNRRRSIVASRPL